VRSDHRTHGTPTKDDAMTAAHPKIAHAPLRARRLAALVCAAALAAALTACSDSSGAQPDGSAPATATSSAQPTAPKLVVDELSEGTQKAGLGIDVKGPVQVNYRKITFPPGAGTGKHCHQGNLVGVVEKGTLTHYAPIYDSGVHEYQAGDSLVEGSGYVHEGKNEGTEDVVLWVTYITPQGDPLSQPDLAKCDAS
jgi:quercetin dioxygenase-like cupin family protein